MKQFLLFFSLLSIVGCAKVEHEYEYAVNCQFSNFYYFAGDKRTLVVTDSEGNVLKAFEIPKGATSFIQRFSYSNKDAPEQYDLHLIDSSNYCFVRVYSFLDVPNGASVFFNPFSGSPTTHETVYLTIEGINSFGELQNAQHQTLYLTHYSAAEKKAKTNTYSPVNRGIVLRLRANGETQFRRLYLPDSLWTGMVSVAWEDFKPETDVKNIELPNGDLVRSLEVNGKPASFHNRSLSDLSEYLPTWFNLPNYFVSGKITAYQFDKYSYDQVREGFPFRLNEPFAVARSDYKAIWKDY